MTDRPILFSGPMVRAILREIECPGTGKTQTRRVLQPQPGDLDQCLQFDDGSWHVTDSRGCNMSPLDTRFTPGDRLWVREACATWEGPSTDVVYKASVSADEWGRLLYDAKNGAPWKIRPSIHMPRWASRLTLTVTDVRVERVQDISEADAKAEGFPTDGDSHSWGVFSTDFFSDLWDSLNAARGYGWDANPWVEATTFTAEQRNIDAEKSA